MKQVIIIACFILLFAGCRKSSVSSPVIHCSYNQMLDSLHIPLGRNCYFLSPSRPDTVIFNADSTVTEIFYGNPSKVTRRIKFDAILSVNGYESSSNPSSIPVFRCMLCSDDTANVSPNSFIGYLADTLLYANGDGSDSTVTYFDRGNTAAALWFKP